MSEKAAPKDSKGARYAIGAIGGAFLGFVAYVVGAIAAKDKYDPTPLNLYLKWNVFDSLGIGFFLALTVGALIGLRIVRRKWTIVGTLLYMSLIVMVSGFVLYSATVMLPKRFTPLNLLLFLAETISLLLALIYSFYTIDRTSRRVWERHYRTMPRAPNSFPKAEFHVPCYNEPPHVVMEVVDHLLRMDYPRDKYRIVVGDDSTDEAARAEIQAFCNEHRDRVLYVHRGNRRGFKAGALNEILTKHTPKDVEIVAVVDADYKVQPDFLKETVGYFEENPELGFLQTPQDFHNVDYSPFTKHIYWANKFFYDAVMPARNEANSIIFCGTMGIVRKRALDEAGGWGEDTLTEDAETSIRIMEKGWQSLYVPKVYGKGMIPESFAAYKSQQYRWAFGGVQILKKHWRTAVFSRMSARQRVDFFAGALHYFSGTVLAVIAMVLLVFGLADLFKLPLTNFHRGEVALMGFVPLFIMLEGVLRMRWALGKTMHLTMKETFAVLGVWFAISFFTTWAALKALFGSKEGFARTPKYRQRKVSPWRAWLRALHLMKFEAAMSWMLGVTGFALLWHSAWNVQYIWRWYPWTTILQSFLLAGWLIWYAWVFSCGPVYAARGSRGPT